MNSKTAKDIIGKWGLKSSSSRHESDLEKYKQENAALRKSMEEVVKGKSKMTEPERNGLLEKMLSQEKEKYNHLLGEKDKEIQNLKDKLSSKNKSSEISLLQSQLEEKTKEAERREQLLRSLSEEIDRLKCNLSTVTAKCSELENRVSTSQASQEPVTNSTASASHLSEVEKNLKDALEKNQQWLLYDQQREAYVRGLLGRIFELEQKSDTASQRRSIEFQSEEVNEAIQFEKDSLQTTMDDLDLVSSGEVEPTRSPGYFWRGSNATTLAKEPKSGSHLLEENKKYYDQLLLTVKSDLETERCTVAQLRAELNEYKNKYEEAQQEKMSLNALLQSHVAEMKALENENKIKREKVQRLKQENETIKGQLREGKKKSEDLLSQVQLLHKSLLKQQEEHTRIALLEQQIQVCTTDFENEKLARLNLQHRLSKALKELSKAREQKTHLEPMKPLESGHVELQDDLQDVFEEKLIMHDGSPSMKHSSLLDESFLECPRCKVQYPTSQHRELLAHIDFCTA